MLNFYNQQNGSANQPQIKNTAVKKIDYTKYEDPEKNLSSKELKWGMWYIKHKSLLFKFLVYFIIVVDIAIVAIALWKWAEYLLGLEKHKILERDLASSVNYSGVTSVFTAQPLQISGSQYLMSRSNKFDAVAIVANPNSRHVVSFDYYFVINGQPTKLAKALLLAGETRPIVQLGNLGSVSGGAPVLVIENLKWRRVSAHLTANAIDWQLTRLNFEAKNFIFLKSLAQAGDNADAVRFDLVNNSPFGYKKADFMVALLQSQSMVGILPLQLENFNSMESREVDLRTLAPGLGATEVAIYPIINIYDESVFGK
ncbi:MAG: hypothetical protein AAB348_03680 [Patescibacteria group bacterium]